MPLRNYYEDEQEFPPPQTPPAPPEGGGGTPPQNGGLIGGYNPPPGEVYMPPVDEGGGGGGGFVLPPRPGFSIPGAPRFNAPVFRRPTMEQAMNEPGYQFRLAGGRDAMERSAAAQGRLRTGGTLSDLMEYGQNFAAQEYANVFNRELANYQNEYRAAHDAYAPTFAQWQMLADAEKQSQLAGWNAQLQAGLQQSAPRGGGGGYDPLEGLLEGLIGEPLPPPPGYAPGGGYGLQGDPWTEYY